MEFCTHADLHDTPQQTWSRDALTLPDRERRSGFLTRLPTIRNHRGSEAPPHPVDWEIHGIGRKLFRWCQDKISFTFWREGQLRSKSWSWQREREENILDMHAHLQAYSFFPFSSRMVRVVILILLNILNGAYSYLTFTDSLSLYQYQSLFEQKWTSVTLIRFLLLLIS